jgi:hypothetical protein
MMLRQRFEVDEQALRWFTDTLHCVKPPLKTKQLSQALKALAEKLVLYADNVPQRLKPD